MKIENYDSARLYHGMSETMPETGSRGLFFDRSTDAPIMGTLTMPSSSDIYIFERHNGGRYIFFYLLEPPASCKTVEELQAKLDVATAALDKLSKLGNEPYAGNSKGNCIAQDALRNIDEVKA